MADVRLEKGILTIFGQFGAITVPAKQVRMITRVRDMNLPDASLRMVEVTYENAGGVLQRLVTDCGDMAAAHKAVERAVDYCKVEMGKGYDD